MRDFKLGVTSFHGVTPYRPSTTRAITTGSSPTHPAWLLSSCRTRLLQILVRGVCGLGLCRLPMILAQCMSDLQFVEPTLTINLWGLSHALVFILALFKYVLVDNRLGWVRNDRCRHHTSGGGPAECCKAMPSGRRCCWRMQSSQSTRQFSIIS